MREKSNLGQTLSLVENLAAISQLNAPRSARRLAGQLRELEAAAKLFAAAGLVRKVQRPSPLDVRVAGIATASPPFKPFLSGYLYAAGAICQDVTIENNTVISGAQNSACSIGEMDYEGQHMRLALLAISQAYDLAEQALEDPIRRDVILMDIPLLLSRAMVVSCDGATNDAHWHAYLSTQERVLRFWKENRDRLYPWNPEGPMVMGIGSGRYGAVLQMASQDLRTKSGRRFVLEGELKSEQALQELIDKERALLGIGGQRFVEGLLSPFTRSAAYRLNIQSPRMEPAILAEQGVVGFHYKGAAGTSTRFVHFLGGKHPWSTTELDQIAGLLMGMSAIGGRVADPLPLLLARRGLQPLAGFLEHFGGQISEQMRNCSSWG